MYISALLTCTCQHYLHMHVGKLRLQSKGSAYIRNTQEITEDDAWSGIKIVFLRQLSKNTPSMDTIQIKDKKFTVSIKEQDILKEVTRVANEINRDLAGKNPLFLSVLNGSFMFTADLLKRITIPCEISFVKLASYQGVSSTGVIKEVIGINEDLTDRTVVIVEDIVDTGLTMQRLLETLGTRGPKEIHIASLLVKPEKLKVDLNIEYAAMNIPNDFIVGYGLDYDGFGRNYPDIYTVVE